MSIAETLDRDFKKALRSKDETQLSTLRLLKTAIKNREIDARRKLTESEIFSVIQGQVKQRRDSIEQFQKGGRSELVAREEAELKILSAYLPQALGREEIEAAVEALVSETGANSVKDLGKVMKVFMERYAGQVDGRLVSEVVKQKLAGR